MPKNHLNIFPQSWRLILSHYARGNQYRAMRQATILREPDTTLAYTLRSFDEHRCIFFHIPRTAGLSIAMSLFDNQAAGHKYAREYCCIFGFDFWKYFKFTFVRNPYTRVVSAYEFLKSGGHPACSRDQRFRDEVILKYKDFSDFILRWLTPQKEAIIPHFRPQHEWLELNGKIAVDFIGHFESLQKDFTKICSKLNIKADLKHSNSSQKSMSLKEYYQDARVIKRVNEVYRKDFELFQYSDVVP